MNQQENILDREAGIYVAGHTGMVGSAIVRRLREKGYGNILRKSHAELDLTRQEGVLGFFQANPIDYVVVAAARVGGVYANSHFPAEFLYQNLMIEANLIHAAFQTHVKRLLFLGSSCIYPRLSGQPIKEEYLLTGLLEPTNEWYAVAKIAGIKLCQAYNQQYGTNYRCVMPSNLYGPGDHYDLMNSHVLPALIRKFHLAKLARTGDWDGILRDESIYGTIPDDVRENLKALSEARQIGHIDPGLTLWGSGNPKRELLHVDDLAGAVVMLMGIPDKFYKSMCQAHDQPEQEHGVFRDEMRSVPHINVGTGQDMTIKELARTVKEVVGYPDKVVWDDSKPDGIPRKLLDVSRMRQTGWKPKIGLKQGIQDTYLDYLAKTK